MKKTPKLANFMHYVLGLHPDEFGLVLDEMGYIKIKSLLQALHEDPEWRFVRHGLINELIMTTNPAPIEIKDKFIRATDRSGIPAPSTPVDPIPKLLYVPIRQRSHYSTTINGMQAVNEIPHIVLATEESMAQRLGRRIDNHPVIVTVKVAESQSRGTVFQQYGNSLYLANHLPVEGLICPPVNKLPVQKQKQETPSQPTQPKMPGSFFMDPDKFNPEINDSEKGLKRKQKQVEWKKDRRQARRYKEHMQDT